MKKDGSETTTAYHQYHYSFVRTAYSHSHTDQYYAGHLRTTVEHNTYTEDETLDRRLQHE